MSTQRRSQRIALFALKFLAIAPIFLVAWWMVVPTYSWILGQASGVMINAISARDIVALSVESGGILGTKTDLHLTTAATGSDVSMTISLILRTAPGFALLVLATPALGIVRRLRALIIGAAVLFVSHILFVVLMYLFVFGSDSPNAELIADVLGKFLLTMPFILWLTLAYWDKVMAFLSDEDGEDAPVENNNATA